MQDLRQLALVRLKLADPSLVVRHGDRRAQGRRQPPAAEESRAEHGMIEPQRFQLVIEDVAAVSLTMIDQPQVRFAQLLDKCQEADVLHQSGGEGFVGGGVKDVFGQLAGGDCFDERPPPVAGQDVGGQTREQLLGQAEAQDEHLQGAGAQEGDRLAQVGGRAGEAEERAVHDPKDAGREGRVPLQAILEGAIVELRLAGQPQHLHGHGGQRIELSGALHELLHQTGRIAGRGAIGRNRVDHASQRSLSRQA